MRPSRNGTTSWALLTLAFALVAGACLLPAGCGGSSGAGDGGAGGSDSAQSAATRPGSKRAAPGVPTSPGGDNSIQTWGVEAGADERTRLAAIVKSFLDARARAEWARACIYLAAKQREMFEALIQGRSGNGACAEAMRKLAASVPAGALARAAEIGEVLSLRVGGGRAFLIYARPNGGVYATALAQEGQAWRVVSVGPTALS